MQRQVLIDSGDCLGHCPVGLPRAHCCRGCHKARRAFYKEHRAESEIANAWQDENGFWNESTGCRLPRPLRPTECLEYDCREQVYVVIVGHLPGERWVRCIREVAANDMTSELLHEKLDSAYVLFQCVHTAYRMKQLNVPERIEKCRTNGLFTCSSD